MTTILLVEDNKYLRLLFEQELRLEGYEVMTAINGKDAIKKVQEQRPDIIIMNLIMQDEAMSMILIKHKSIPIIIHTSQSDYKDNFMSWAADAYVVKFSHLTELKNKIKGLRTKEKELVFV
ncbi:MAG: response regulator [Candidatus Kuenenia sp.]|nr:response regulator [Candidatus Kuenenia hertensis]